MWCKIFLLKNMLFKNLGLKYCFIEKNYYLCICIFIKYYDNVMVKCKYYEYEMDIMWWRVIKKSKCWFECGKLKIFFLIKNLN